MSDARPTTKDLAKAAGVSLATVDRVLNARPGVRKTTLDVVNEAIERIGFVRNQFAANLARSRQYRFVFLLPETGGEFLSALLESIHETQAAFGTEAIEIAYEQVLSTSPHQAAQAISAIDANRIDGVAIMAPESPQVRDAMLRLAERGVQVVQFISGQHGLRPFDFVGIDSHAAGATAGQLLGRFMGGRSGKILVVAETMNSLDSVERRLGFDEVITRAYPSLTPLPTLETHGSRDRTRQVIKTSYAHHPDIVAAYVLTSEAKLVLEAISEFSDPSEQVILTHERTPHIEAMLQKGHVDATISQNLGHLVRSAVRVMKARSDNRPPLASQEQVRIEILLKENMG